MAPFIKSSSAALDFGGQKKKRSMIVTGILGGKRWLCGRRTRLRIGWKPERAQDGGFLNKAQFIMKISKRQAMSDPKIDPERMDQWEANAIPVPSAERLKGKGSGLSPCYPVPSNCSVS